MKNFLLQRPRNIVLIVLTVFNIGVLSVVGFNMWQKHGRSHYHQSERKCDTGKRLTEDLGLTEEQTVQFDTLHSAFRQQTQPIIASLQDKRQQIITLLAEPEPDTLALNRIADDIGELHTQLKKAAIEQMISMKNICTPEQQTNLLELFRKIPEHSGYGGRNHHNGSK